MDISKIAVIYDTSYLMGEFQSLKEFIFSRRFSSREKQHSLGFKKAMQTVYHDPRKLFAIVEIIPTEVVEELDDQSAVGPQKLAADLLKDGALGVDLAMDTVVSSMIPQSATDKQISLYAQRLVSFATRERYALAVIATENEKLLTTLADLAKQGKDVFGVKYQDIVRTRLLHNKLTEIANRGRSNPVVMEN